jgi:chromosome segregation ATPase
MSEEGPTPATLEQQLAELEKSLVVAKADLGRQNNRLTALTHLLQQHNTMLGQVREGPEVSLVLFHQQRERIAKTSEEISKAMQEAAGLVSSIRLGEKTLKVKREELQFLLRSAPTTGVVLQFKRPDDDRA